MQTICELCSLLIGEPWHTISSWFPGGPLAAYCSDRQQSPMSDQDTLRLLLRLYASSS